MTWDRDDLWSLMWAGSFLNNDEEKSFFMDLFRSLSHDVGRSHHTSHYICVTCSRSHLSEHTQHPMIILIVPQIPTSCFCLGHRAKVLPCIQHMCQILQSKTVDGWQAIVMRLLCRNSLVFMLHISSSERVELANPSWKTQAHLHSQEDPLRV